ncbi:MAG: hypothetical protein ASARMPREDX12_003557 [Alectoria sarmentosa]|nr:MAG: hypothetical protein ASARMPREDX12_003557 [Alectoria sarmentosa]
MYSSYSVAAAVCSVVFPTLATLAVVLRFRARKLKSLKYGTDDYVIVAALVSNAPVKRTASRSQEHPVSVDQLLLSHAPSILIMTSCIVAGAVRLYFGYKLSEFKGVVVRDSYYSYVSINLIIWSEIEPCMSIVAACLPTFGPLIQGGFSLPSLARSFQSRIFKQSTSTSTESEPRGVSGWPASNYTPKSDGSWNRLHDENNRTPHSADVELGERKAHNDQWLSPEEIPKAKQAWVQQNTPSYTGHVEMGRLEPRTQELGGIRVEKSFAAQSEQLSV